MPLVAVDPELFAVLLLLTSLDGVRRVQAGTITFRRTLFGPWRAQERLLRTRWGLPAPLTPLVMAITAAEESTGPPPSPDAVVGRYLATKQRVRILRVLGTAQLSFLLIGIPFGVRRWSGIGFLTALSLTLFLGVIIALLAKATVRRLPSTGVPHAGTWLPWLSPFSAASAAQSVLQETLRSAPPVYVAHLLLPPSGFQAWVRPLAYDVLHGAEHPGVSVLLTEAEMRAVVDQPPAADADAATYCRRCGVAWRHEEGDCASCRVALSPMPAR